MKMSQHRDDNQRVVVTGVGCVCPVGHSAKAAWSALQEGVSGGGQVTRFDASSFPTKVAAEVNGFDLSAHIPNPNRIGKYGLNVQFGLAAAHEAVAMSGILSAAYSPERLGVYLGAGEGTPDFMAFAHSVVAATSEQGLSTAEFMRHALQTLDPAAEAAQEPNVLPALMGNEFGFCGHNSNTLTACSASAQAIGESVELLRHGHVDAMISGGSHSMIHPFGMTGFCLLTAMTTNNDNPRQASRPFDLNRDGFLLGEGAGMVVLETLAGARRRGAPILGEVLGYGSAADAYRVTDMHPEGRGAIQAMSAALIDAQLNPDQIDYINAHGTSTPVNDKTESKAILRVFGDTAARLPVSSTKSMTGHLVAAGGAVEAIYCLLAMRDGIIPPTINFETPDPACPLDCVPNAARGARLRNVLSNSFGFGGQNVSLAFGSTI
jgi:3-oxoacyl-[acyl-carrier-protein] synthase II